MLKIPRATINNDDGGIGEDTAALRRQRSTGLAEFQPGVGGDAIHPCGGEKEAVGRKYVADNSWTSNIEDVSY